ncbi:MAG TPA: cytidine deaminase [Flavitalea sp.]|nr:cytidine deaminase [Flavitalea sp.]
MKKSYSFSVDVYDSVEGLPKEDALLLEKAQEATAHAYAPYSEFNVGAVAKMANGEFLSGTNQENASYPIGICAERVLLSVASAVYPGVPIDSIAISYKNLHGESDHPIAPCGICRQSLHEYEERMNHPIRLILGGMKGQIYVIEQAGQLLPLAFTKNELL